MNLWATYCSMKGISSTRIVSLFQGRTRRIIRERKGVKFNPWQREWAANFLGEVLLLFFMEDHRLPARRGRLHSNCFSASAGLMPYLDGIYGRLGHWQNAQRSRFSDISQYCPLRLGDERKVARFQGEDYRGILANSKAEGKLCYKITHGSAGVGFLVSLIMLYLSLRFFPIRSKYDSRQQQEIRTASANPA